MDCVTVFYTSGFDGRTSRELLLKTASIYSGAEEREFTLIHEHGSKPYFSSHPDVHFSLSHSENVWMAAFAGGEVGLDVQFYSCRVNTDRIARRFFHPSEFERYRELGDFYETWSRKEAFCKLLGWGIDSRFASVSTCPDSGGKNAFVSSMGIVIKEIPLDFGRKCACYIAYHGDFIYNIHKL